MKAIYINPEDIGTYYGTQTWALFCLKFGYLKETPESILVLEIKEIIQ